MADDTIFALSSGAPPAAIGLVRVSGARAGDALTMLSGTPPPEPRKAVLRTLRDADGALLDRALVLFYRAPASVTGEDVVELHCHGGRAIIAAVERALEAQGCRRAEPGEFTRRAFQNGRLNLTEAEGLADLLAAETELQRLAAVDMAGGRFSAKVEGWRQRVLRLSALVEVALDFADDDGAGDLPSIFRQDVAVLADELADWLNRPRAERLREGIRVIIAGPPNSGKSTLFNALLEDEAAITSPEAGTTRDVLERNVALDGVPFTFVDTAGLRDEGAGAIEAIGIARARQHIGGADLVLWLGPEADKPVGAWDIDSRIDAPDHRAKCKPAHRVSGVTNEGVPALKRDMIDHARNLLPKPGQLAVNRRQAHLLSEAMASLHLIGSSSNELIIAEYLRQARLAFDKLLGRTTTEDMLDTLFSRFCIGK